jgi:DNA-binding NarL/FixJ family response regulator
VVGGSRHDNPERVMACVEAGAIGYLRKETLTPESLVASVGSVGAGSGVLAPEMLAGILERISEASRTVLEPRGLRLSRLPAREHEVLRRWPTATRPARSRSR